MKMKPYSRQDLPTCPGCGVEVDEIHVDGCNKERCSVCGDQRIACDCDGHVPEFKPWDGHIIQEVELD